MFVILVVGLRLSQVRLLSHSLHTSWYEGQKDISGRITAPEHSPVALVRSRFWKVNFGRLIPISHQQEGYSPVFQKNRGRTSPSREVEPCRDRSGVCCSCCKVLITR